MAPANTTDPTFPAHDCPAFLAVVHRVLDRELAVDVLRGPLVSGCDDCRTVAAGAARLLTGLPVQAPVCPDGLLAERIVRAALRDRRRRARQRWAIGAGVLAASVAVAAAVFYPAGPAPHGNQAIVLVHTPEPSVDPQPESPPPVPPVRVSDQVAEAGSALAAMSRKVADQTVTPARNLITVTDPIAASNPMDPFEPATDGLASMPNSAKAGLEPMTTGARRAFNLFLRDTGFAPKPNS